MILLEVSLLTIDRHVSTSKLCVLKSFLSDDKIALGDFDYVVCN